MARRSSFFSKVVTGTAVALCTLGVVALGGLGLDAARDALDKHKLKDAEERVEDVLSAKELDLTTNWASSENIGFWSADNGGKAKYNDDAESIRMNYAYVRYTEGGEKQYASLSILPDLIERAVEEGATHISFKFTSSGNFNFWGKVYGADNVGLNLLGAQELPDGDVYMIDLDTLYNDASQKYSIAWTAAGWWASGQYIEVSDVYFETVETMMEKGLADNKTNWANAVYKDFWETETGAFTTSDKGFLELTRGAADTADATLVPKADNKVSINKNLLAAAVKAGYTHVTVTSVGTSYNWFTVYDPNDVETPLAKQSSQPAANAVITYEIALADLLNEETEEYELVMTNLGWAVGNKVDYTGLTFSTKIVEENSTSSETSDEVESTSSDSSAS